MYTHGGKRKNAGRKPVEDPKTQISIYPLSSEVKLVGGPEAAKELAVKAIKIRAKKLKNT
jgi:hypothetical protein